MPVHFETNIENVQVELQEAMEAGLMAMGLFIRDAIITNIGNDKLVDTSNLRGSISYVVDGEEKSVTIGTPVEYAIYLEFGTGIYAENGQGRQTPWGYTNRYGETVFTWGTRPRRFLRRAFEDNLSKLAEVYSKVYDRIKGD